MAANGSRTMEEARTGKSEQEKNTIRGMVFPANKITRRWILGGTRPRAIQDQRRKWAYVFGAICPELGVGPALVMPYADTGAMQAHL